MGKAGPKARPIEDRFWPKVDKTGDHWMWRGAVRRDEGCGWLWGGPGRHAVRAHRLSWEILHGPLPPGARVRVVCGERLCVNPAHMEVTGP